MEKTIAGDKITEPLAQVPQFRSWKAVLTGVKFTLHFVDLHALG